ncbi:DUF448 domain-containing protein [Novosphingobium sp. KCTC 2891]|uniref:DUF448 domain-containing protein n=1 Tax=Novosphingobium sp. KCTC 2891 TaxID=2989730 RepID=UPI0022234FF4|nr:DUF448 domain-containing protein [Novosphingobium sp. KCTC 2891]MCW1383431.1 DUF448 domain-containing protein [Novosphingobium sp. KCTC 2891]
MRNPRNEPLSAARPKTRAAGETPPERKCILTGRHGDRDDLVRLAISPEGLVLPDPLARAPGRGAWIGISRADLEKAAANGKLKGALARAFKGAPLTIPEDLGQRTESGLVRALTDRLGIELRAGNILLGTEKIAQGCRSGAVRFLAHASDAGSDGPNKLAQAWRVGEQAEGSGLKGVILPLDRAALSVALGRDNVVHLGITDAAATERVAGPLRRLMRFLGHETDAAVEPDSGEAANDDIDTKGE